MTPTKAPIAVTIESRQDKRGFRVRVCNHTLVPVLVTVPHPRERVWLFQDDKSLYRDALPMVWQKEPPHRITSGNELVADVSLVPFWMDVKGECRIECDVLYSNDEVSGHKVKVSGVAEVDLPSREQLQAEKKQIIEKCGLENVPSRPTIVIVKEGASVTE